MAPVPTSLFCASVLSDNVKESGKIKKKKKKTDLHQTLMGFSHAKTTSLHQLWCKLVQYKVMMSTNVKLTTVVGFLWSEIRFSDVWAAVFVFFCFVLVLKLENVAWPGSHALTSYLLLSVGLLLPTQHFCDNIWVWTANHTGKCRCC